MRVDLSGVVLWPAVGPASRAGHFLPGAVKDGAPRKLVLMAAAMKGLDHFHDHSLSSLNVLGGGGIFAMQKSQRLISLPIPPP